MVVRQRTCRSIKLLGVIVAPPHPPLGSSGCCRTLESLAAKMVRSRHFGYLKIVADLLVGLSGPGWSRLADQDRMRYLEQMQIDFHPRGMGDSGMAQTQTTQPYVT